jgi:hypothetical protein
VQHNKRIPTGQPVTSEGTTVPPVCCAGQESSISRLDLRYAFPLPLRFNRMRLSFVMPVYNECATPQQVVERVLAVPLGIKLICVDDRSADGSREILAQLRAERPQIRILLQLRMCGKARL